MAANSVGEATRVITPQQDSVRQYASPIGMVRNLWANRELLKQFTKRQVLQRYKGSYLGVLWSFATPLLMLAVYTYVFSVIFQARWATATMDSHLEFGLILFAGLVAFNVFSETIIATPRLITGNANYVKKVVFPLEVLPLSILGAALVQSLFSMAILVTAAGIILGELQWTLVFLPLVYLPLILLCMGLGWFLTSLGVYLRDLEPFLGVVIQTMIFVTPIFYPMEVVPERLRVILYLNPLTTIVNNFRRVILFGQPPAWEGFSAVLGATFAICMLGYIWFMKSKKTFSDIV